MTSQKIANEFISTRAELLPEDVWGRYIVLPLFNRIPVFLERRSLRVRGGRGCGKTMFLRYLCHSTRFSPRRENVPLDEFKHVGLFWRPDTQFCGLMKQEWLGEQDAKVAFIHYATLVILDEIANAFESIAHARIPGDACDLRSMQLPSTVKAILGNTVTDMQSLKDFSLIERAKLETWVQNPTEQRPVMLRFEILLQQLAEAAGKVDGRLKDLFFRIFVDEFENLQEHQRRLVCDYVKHPGKRFNVCFAVRQNAIAQFRTSGQEQIVENHDVFTIDLEKQLGNDEGRDFLTLAAEFLLQGVVRSKAALDVSPFDPQKLVDEDSLTTRMQPGYRSDILSKARQILPGMTAPEIAREVMTDKALRRRLVEMIDKGLRFHNEKNLTPDDFIDDGLPEASIVAGAVINRTKPGPKVLHDAMKSLKAGTDSGGYFSGLIDNNLHGCLFYLYIGLPRRPNLLYSGFDRFCALSSPNLRFFQQLCHASFALAQDGMDHSLQEPVLQILPEIQAQAAEQVSETSLAEIERLGLRGTQLLEVMRRLGLLFAAAHRRPSQSEVEINHFSIDQSDRVGLSAESKELIEQAKIWSVFYEEQYTKNKSDYDQAQTDIIPNPLYSPIFRISYRKKKKLTLTATQVNILMTGSGEQFDAVLRDYSERWRTSDDVNSLTTPTTLGLF